MYQKIGWRQALATLGDWLRALFRFRSTSSSPNYGASDKFVTFTYDAGSVTRITAVMGNGARYVSGTALKPQMLTTEAPQRPTDEVAPGEQGQ